MMNRWTAYREIEQIEWYIIWLFKKPEGKFQVFLSSNFITKTSWQQAEEFSQSLFF